MNTAGAITVGFLIPTIELESDSDIGKNIAQPTVGLFANSKALCWQRDLGEGPDQEGERSPEGRPWELPHNSSQPPTARGPWARKHPTLCPSKIPFHFGGGKNKTNYEKTKSAPKP